MRTPSLAVLSSLLLLTGCNLFGPTEVPSPEVLAADVAKRKVATPGLNTLGFKVFNRMEAESQKGNLALSPASLSRAILMAYAGARGSTRGAMATALGMPDQSDATLESYAAATGPSLDKRGVDIHVADSVWIQSGFSVQPTYTNDLRRYFQAEALSFATPDDGAAKLQAWIKRSSQGLLDGQGFQLADDIRLALADVLTFKGRWDQVFDTSQTQPRPFHPTPQASLQVPTMHDAGHYRYGEGNGYQVVRLPYEKGAYAMYVVLASDSVAVPGPLDAEGFNQLVETRMRDGEGEIWLPRFKFQQFVPLTDLLRASGMELAFSDAADLSGIAPSLKLGRVDQQIRVAVDEEGTVAAAATVAQVGPTSVSRPFQLEVNRPFYFVIRDDLTGGVLFVGKVNHPE